MSAKVYSEAEQMAAKIKRMQDELARNIKNLENPPIWNIFDNEALKIDIRRIRKLIADLQGGTREPFTTGDTATPTSEIIETPVAGPATLGDFVRPRKDGPKATIERVDMRSRGPTFNNVSLVQQAHAAYQAEMAKYNTTFSRGGISVPRVTLEERQEILTAIGDRGLGGTLPKDY